MSTPALPASVDAMLELLSSRAYLAERALATVGTRLARAQSSTAV